MRKLEYPCTLEEDEETGGFVASIPDIPEALTCGETIAEALGMAEDALSVAMTFYLEEDKDVPLPGRRKAGQYLVSPSALMSLKVALREALKETAAYECEHCQARTEEHHKTWMLENGEWRSTTKPENDDVKTAGGKTAGFHLSSLYSPIGWRSWKQIAGAWLAAQGSDAAVKSVKNTDLGETWEEVGEAPDWQRLYDRREDYREGAVPEGGLLLTAGVDIRKDRIEASIWAWGRDKESWLVEHRVIDGDTSREEIWNELTALLSETWSHASGVQLPLKRLAIDSGSVSY